MYCGKMLDKIISAAKSDPELAELYDKMQDYAQMYIYVKRRQKGCDGLGELNNLKDEVRTSFDVMVDYCKRKQILNGPSSYELDTMVEELEKMSNVLAV